MLKLVLLIITLFFTVFSQAREETTNKLKKAGNLGVDFKTCNEIENKIGQLLYINVDGFGQQGKNTPAISPAYIKLVKDLNIGGVLPHTNEDNPKKLQIDMKKLMQSTTQPLLIGVDYLGLSGLTKKLKKRGLDQNAAYADEGDAFGLGYGSGFLGSYGRNNLSCLERISFLDAFLHKAVGLNQALGPTLDQNPNAAVNVIDPKLLGKEKFSPIINTVLEQFSNLGVVTTQKHFPYTPDTYNLHEKSEDNLLSKTEVLKRIDRFKEHSHKSGFVMTTHLMNSNIDPNEVATFSKPWFSILREHIGFDGLVMTDGLFMFSGYGSDDEILKTALKWPQDKLPIKNKHVIFALKSILAGHDMVLLEGTASETKSVFEGILQAACQDNSISSEVRSRINESYNRIIKWKENNKEILAQQLNIPDSLLEEAQALYPATAQDCPGSKKFNDFKEKVEKLEIKPIISNQGYAPHKNSKSKKTN